MADNAARVEPYGEGVPCWVDAQLPDVEAGKRFYGELFGWRFEDAYGTSTWAYRDNDPVAALAPKADGRLPTTWTLHFATPDATALAGRIEAAGGQVVTAPVPVGPLGTTALVTDPEGAVFALWQPGTHHGFARRHEPGTFAWAELYARDTKVANDFYGTLFHDALFGPGASPDFGRADLAEVFPPEMPPHFLVHFGAEDAEDTLVAVRRLGGRVQVPPFDASYGRVAVVTDDQGASFALLQR
ncbi:VOC family protein [Streptomyces phyllanthi]|uniref:VOC family protein n=1 Tax=Streptomyces phyllanthi TaxID=1803180 RepID=A0A5N8WHT0_9ACTN|nr:VOC family protein [Streptomyces phyllanthi]MPY46779.1 VOC family protein [Streptomyces phyllanthi]